MTSIPEGRCIATYEPHGPMVILAPNWPYDIIRHELGDRVANALEGPQRWPDLIGN